MDTEQLIKDIVRNVLEKLQQDSTALKSQQTDGSGLTKKTVITVSELDSYAQTGINVNGNVILTPLAKDEAVRRGIKITYST